MNLEVIPTKLIRSQSIDDTLEKLEKICREEPNILISLWKEVGLDFPVRFEISYINNLLVRLIEFIWLQNAKSDSIDKITLFFVTSFDQKREYLVGTGESAKFLQLMWALNLI